MTIEELISLINRKLSLDIRNKKRDNIHVFARCIYYDIAYNILKLGTMQRIADAVGKDHASLIHSLNRVLPDLSKYFPSVDQVREEILLELDLVSLDSLTLREKVAKLIVINKRLKSRMKKAFSEETTYTEDEIEILEILKDAPKHKLNAIKVILDQTNTIHESNDI